MDGEAVRVVLVGHCKADSFMLKSVVERALGRAEIERANSPEELARELPRADVLLVNREMEGSFANSCGVELIREHSGAPGAPCMLLVSNYPDAQERAEKAGAKPGFGKARCGGPEAAERLRAAADSARKRRGESAPAAQAHARAGR